MQLTRNKTRGLHAQLARLAMAVLFLASTLSAAGQASQSMSDEDPSRNEGVSIQVRLSGLGVGYESDHDGSGSGGAFRIGYGFNDRVSIFLGIEGTNSVDGGGDFDGLADGQEYDFGFIDLGARYHFRSSHRWVPFAEGSLSVMGLSYDGDDTVDNKEVTYAGLGVSIGGGVMYHILPGLAVETIAIFTPAKLTAKEIGNDDLSADIKAAGMRVGLGLTWNLFQ